MNVEKDISVEPMSEYEPPIENKKSDGVSLNLKAQAWEKLSRGRNDIHGVRPRDAKQLNKGCLHYR